MSFTLLCACWFSCCFSKCQPRKHVTLIRWFTFNLFRFSCFLVLLLILIKLFIVLQKKSSTLTLREKGPNTEFFLVRIFLYSEQKKLHIWTLNAVLHHILLIMGLLEVSFKFIPEFYDLMIKWSSVCSEQTGFNEVTFSKSNHCLSWVIVILFKEWAFP